MIRRFVLDGVTVRADCADCGQQKVAMFADHRCKKCVRSILKERLAALDDRESIFRQRVRKSSRHYKRYIRFITRIKFIRARKPQTPMSTEAASMLVTRCEELMDNHNVPDNFFEIVPDEEKIEYLSEVESEPECSFSDEDSSSSSSSSSSYPLERTGTLQDLYAYWNNKK
jgi:hypothetical protein